MYKSKLTKVIVSLLRRILGVTRSGAKRLMRAMLRTLAAMARRSRLPVAGFVLPTVTMVLLVVILLTVAIVLRSFDRANTARNVRVNQQVLAAATPAIDRAKAKIQFLLYDDPQKPTATPSDENLYARMANATSAAGATDLYTFGDEQRLILRASLSDTPGIPNPTADPRGRIIFDPTANPVVENEAMNTAWRYPVDTDNDGNFDTFTLYGIFFRTPARSNVPGPTEGDFTRSRRPIEARTPPMSGNATSDNCRRGGGTVASLVSDLGWYKMDDGLLKKSFFVYTVNVPITEAEAAALGGNYRAFRGTTSISALEYQQDQSRIPLANNAAVYEDDMDISPGPRLNLNGGILSNSNLLVSGTGNPDNGIFLYQISSPESCFYNQQSSKITVGGNVVSGWSGSNAPRNPVGVHLFQRRANLPGVGGRTAAMQTAARNIDIGNQSATGNTSLQVLYNNAAYAARLSMLVAARRGQNPPDEAVEPVAPDDPFSVRNKPDTQTRKQALEEHFKQTLRKVPFAEVGPTGVGATQNPTQGYSLPWAPPLPPETPGAWPLQGEGTDDLRPPDEWSIPDPARTGIQLTPNQLEATDPSTNPAQEAFLGDRVLAGNNLPALRWDASRNKLTGEPQDVPGGTWAGTTVQRTRSPRVIRLSDVGATDRSGFWEGEAARVPVNPLDGNGGLRVITGAGVYERINSFLPPPSWQDPVSGAPRGGTASPADTYDDPTTPTPEAYPVVWPDTMPMSPLGPGSQVYNNNPASGALGWVPWPGAPLPATPPAFPPGGLTPTGLLVAAGSAIDTNTPQYAKGDLRMRAAVVYHYANNPTAPGTFNQTPLACISSYYDPSTASTARNLLPLPDVSGDTALGERGSQVGSNNGVVYSAAAIVGARPGATSTPGSNGLFSGGTALEQQANLVFPDGRFVNPLLREALAAPDPANRSLAQTAAIDSTNCALQILDGTATQDARLIPPDGNRAAIKEVAFLNAREIKAVDRDDVSTPNVNEAFTLSSPLTSAPPAQPANLTGNYNLPLEEREPLEIRATQIDLDLLRRTQIGTEYLLPNSGIIYASRDDALPDRSNRTPGAGGNGIDESRSATISPTDSLLDPTRKPNGILLVNGQQLARIPGIGTNPRAVDVVREKGLTLASNLPVYIQGDFNLHTQQEFDEPFDWASFYDRANLNENFACRQNDPRVSGCTTGDTWRPANVLSDAITLLSANFRFGFRNEGDFDLRNNAGAAAVFPRKQQGFFSNNFVTNGLSSGAFSANGGIPANPTELVDASYANNTALRSSYFNNFATPVQRRGQFPEYVMEVCTKLPVSACGDADWYVNPAAAADSTLSFGKATVGQTVTPTTYPAGTTAIPPAPELQRFPRRIAFQRTYTPAAPAIPTNSTLDSPATPVPLGIDPVSGNVISVTAAGQTRTTSTNALWFATTATPGATTVTYGSDDIPFVFNPSRMDSTGAELPDLTAAPTASNLGSQPLLMPVLQTQTVGPAGRSAALPTGGAIVQTTGWIPRAASTTFNLILGSNDTPSRTLSTDTGDFNGGLQNLARFLEGWTGIANNIQGSFIQFNRSTYNTAPYIPILASTAPQQANPDTQLRSLFAPPGLATLPTIPAPPPATITYTPTPPEAGYRTANASIGGATNLGRIPFFTAPIRNWGYDVGLVPQSPDLFTQRFTAPPADSTPDEFFREIPRNDLWVQTLMCAEVAPPPPGTSGPPAIAIGNPNRPACPPPNT